MKKLKLILVSFFFILLNINNSFSLNSNLKIISGKEKLVKPDAQIYKVAINRFNLIPEETVFIDDKKENIEAANKLGFLTIHLTDPEIINQEINRFI